ncbi:RNA 2',3'-cyclic phosphodiesterase [Chloroflexota bacterium]
MEQIRSFVSIELPDELKLGLAQLEAQLKSGKQAWVKWVDPNSIHLTLKFLGNIAIDRTGEITRAMEEAARGIPPFHLEVKDLGVFPNLKRVQVAWVGLSGEVDKISQLQQRLESNLERLGFAPESRAFTPHLTLARLHHRASLDERQRFGQLIADTSFEAGTIKVDAISLMRSQLTRGGAIYSRLSLVGLKSLPTFDT